MAERKSTVCRFAAALCLPALLCFALAQRPAWAEVAEDAIEAIVLDEAPDFSGLPTDAPFIAYAAPDTLGRAGAACALLGPEQLTDAPRPDMSEIRLPGLHNARYDFIRDGWVYNRCHLIGHRFGGASAPENLFVGTHALNHVTMLAWEDRVADYIRRTKGMVFLRVTPVYEGDDLVCAAVRLEALSLDGGLSFCVLCPNAQPGVAIDYATGYTTLADDWQSGGMTAGPRRYVLNANTGKFHLPECADAQAISPRNRREYDCARGELLAQGMIPCGKCHP